jgi:tetratricopeptide (TPR) repeat protein
MRSKRSPGRGAEVGYHSVDSIRINTWAAMLGVVTLVLGGFLTNNWGGSALVALAVAFSLRWLTMRISGGTGDAVLHALQPSGASTPYEQQYSYQESLAIKGDIAGAIASYEAILSETPEDYEARIRVAELYARKSEGKPEKAAEYFRMVQRDEQVPPEKHVYVANRLVDLYLGPLNNEGRALVELRRLIEKFPNTAVANQARTALANLKKSQPAS